MDPEEPGASRSAFKDVLQLISFLKPFKKQMLKALLIVGTMNALTAGMLFLVGKGLTLFADRQATGPEAARTVAWVAGIYFLMGMGRVVLVRFREPVVMRLAMDLLRRLRTTLYGKVQQLSFSYLDRLTSGQIIERATGDINQIRSYLIDGCFQAFDAVIMGLVAIGFMLAMNPLLTLITLAPLPVIGYIYFKAARELRALTMGVRDEVDVMTSRLTEAIGGARVIRSFGKQEREKARYLAVLEEIVRRVAPIFKIRAIRLNGVYVLARIWGALLLGIGGYLVMHKQMEIGFIFPFMGYIMWLLWRIQMLMELGNQTQEARAAYARVVALLEAKPDVEDAPGARDLPPGGGQVVFDNVSFAYHQAPHPDDDVLTRMDPGSRRRGPDAVQDVRLKVQPGQTIALVGPTGAGKSTVVSLLPRFYDPDEGRILIDGQDIRQTTLDSLRAAIGIVFQETFLFRGTIADNIAYGRPEATRGEIEAAGRLAQVEEFVSELPLGYDTEIGERGVSLSGGQRQRIAIARAILRRPRILILDDALASVDPTTELLIRKELLRLMKGRTTFIIAHRLATVRAAHCVVVMRQGRIDDVGTHAELLERNDFYRTLCQSQLEPEAPAGNAPEPAAEGPAAAPAGGVA
jgi:ABC-type multidrug transport system fused ATPase/permease subunit